MTPIKKLPNNLKRVGGFLDIQCTEITKLPSGIIIDSFLDIEYTKISELPNDIIIYGNLYCYGSALSEKYTVEEIKNKWNIHGDVYNYLI